MNTKVKLDQAQRFEAMRLAEKVMEDPVTAAFELVALRKAARLASELCTAIDNGEKDIGGSRPVRDILAELGPTCDAAGV